MVETSDIYRDPELARWLGSMEGVPSGPSGTPAEQAGRTAQNRLHQVFGWPGTLCPAWPLAAVLASAGLRGSHWLGTTILGFAHSPISPIMVALVLGLVIRNAIGLPTVYEGGLKFCLKYVLRLGIMLPGPPG